MKGVFICAVELEAMHGCAPLAGVAYLWLRSFADLRSGVVGRSRPVSLSMLRAYCETHTPKGEGVQVVQPSERNVRTALSGLERAGLLQRIGDDRRLVFRLPLMQTLPLVPIEPDAYLTGEQDAEPGVDIARSALRGAGFSPTRGSNPAENPQGVNRPNLTHIGDQRSKPLTPHTAATHEPGLRAREAVAAGGRAEVIAGVLRGAGVRVCVGDPALDDLVQREVTDNDLLAAVDLARQARAADGSSQPIGIRFVVSLLDRVRGRQKRIADAWWASVPAMEAKARELGIAGARPGEDLPQFRDRIRAAISAAA